MLVTWMVIRALIFVQHNNEYSSSAIKVLIYAQDQYIAARRQAEKLNTNES